MMWQGILRKIGPVSCVMTILCAASPAMAQFLPYGGSTSGRYYGGWGAAAQQGSYNRQYIQQKGQLGQEQRQATRSQAAGQSSMLLQQSRSKQSSLGQTQGSVDQLRMAQAQRMSQQHAQYTSTRYQSSVPMTDPNRLPGLQLSMREKPPLPAETTPAETTPPAELGSPDDLRWPSLLSQEEFDPAREKLEDLLREADKSEAGVASRAYDEMLTEMAQLKATLAKMAAKLNSAEYLAVDRFLSDLTARIVAAKEKAAP
ncbi:MAG: hypothetical protein HQ581_19750 [Planctomycetes bacterium]|nr:hypothetical protein [Planctomycetota bacterium]